MPAGFGEAYPPQFARCFPGLRQVTPGEPAEAEVAAAASNHHAQDPALAAVRSDHQVEAVAVTIATWLDERLDLVWR